MCIHWIKLFSSSELLSLKFVKKLGLNKMSVCLVFQEGLYYCVQKRLPILLSKGDIKLVVVDSIASLFRCEYDHTNMVKRYKDLSSLGACLYQLSHQHNIPIVCVNQVWYY